MRFLLLPLFIFSVNISFAQCKTYQISSKGDTLNCVDYKGMKQGKWIVNTPKLRGEPGSESEGIFINDKKEGVWRTFNLMGDLIAQENYRWGNLHGKQRYYTLAGLEREESWRAVNPDKAFDTLDVPDPANPLQFERIVVKNEGGSIKHGIWRSFNPYTGALIEAEEYIMGQLKSERDNSKVADNSEMNMQRNTNSLAKSERSNKSGAVTDSSSKGKTKALPKEVAEFNKKQAKKNKPVVTGRTGH